MIPLLMIPASLALLGIWMVVAYNKLVRLRNMAQEAWSGVDVQLKRRVNLIPNLVETVKGYAAHEQKLLTRVTQLRQKSLAAGTVKEQEAVENELSRALGGILAVAEAYPDLKANQNFLDLSGQLAGVEEQIQLARRYYNGAARNLNIAVEAVPTNILASLFHFSRMDFFEIEDPGDRALPQVKF
ncbi:MAG: LemA family protein [Proteobacteria bacterium]|nr:LemA family protein [Pseudomonadota bacterium]